MSRVHQKKKVALFNFSGSGPDGRNTRSGTVKEAGCDGMLTDFASCAGCTGGTRNEAGHQTQRVIPSSCSMNRRGCSGKSGHARGVRRGRTNGRRGAAGGRFLIVWPYSSASAGSSLMHDGKGMETGGPTEVKPPVWGSIRNTATFPPGMFAHRSNSPPGEIARFCGPCPDSVRSRPASIGRRRRCETPRCCRALDSCRTGSGRPA